MRLAGLTKSELTKATIVDAAVDMARQSGLESLTIGTVAERTGLSKSGVFSRIGSREDLQVAALKEYERRFVEQVMMPALREPRGLPRLRAMFNRWAELIGGPEAKASCLFIVGAVEFDDRPGPVRDALVAGIGEWRKQLARAIRQAIDEGQLASETDPEQLAFELCSLIHGLHNDFRLLGDARALARAKAAFERLLRANGARS